MKKNMIPLNETHGSDPVSQNWDVLSGYQIEKVCEYTVPMFI